MIVINGDPNSAVAAGSTVRLLLGALGIDPEARGIAVAVDRSVIPRAEWDTCTVADEARVEILTAVQGG